METLGIPEWTLQERLAKAREYAHLDRHQMANRLGVTERTVRNWEHGRIEPTRATVLAYSAVTHVPMVWLAGDMPDPGGITAVTHGYTKDRRLPTARILSAAA